MSEQTQELVEAEAGQESESEAGEGFESEAAPGEAQDAWYDSDSSRRARQIRMLRARQEAQLRRQPTPTRPQPPAPQRMTRFTGPSTSQIREIQTDVISLDLDTKAALARLRRALNESGRLQYRTAWAGEAFAASALIINSFPGLEDWARALIMSVPTIGLTPFGPGKRRPAGLEGILGDPRISGGLGLAAIATWSHFRNESRRVSRLQINYTGPLTAAAGANHTAQLTAVAFDKAGNVLPNVTFTYAPQNPGLFNITETSPGVATLTGANAGTTWLTVHVNGKPIDGTFVEVT